MSHTKLYFIFPISGPNNGVKIISNHILQFFKKDNSFQLEAVDTSQAESFKNFGKLNIKKILQTLGLFHKISKVGRREYVYLNLTPKGFAFYRDLCLAFICKIKGANTTIHIHANGLERKLGKINRWVLKKSKIIVINADQYTKLAHKGLKVEILQNALPDYYKHGEQKIIKAGSTKIRFLFFSNLSKEKGIFRLKKIIEKFHEINFDCEVDICGGVLDNEAEIVMAEIVSKYDFVYYHGQISEVEKKFKLLSKSDFLLFLSDEGYEVSPLVYIEALMSSLPIITTKQVVANELILAQCAFLVKNFPEDLLNVVSGEAFNEERMIVIKENCRHFYKTHYCFEDFISNIKKIILK